MYSAMFEDIVKADILRNDTVGGNSTAADNDGIKRKEIRF